jgi:hypothetical protein
LNTLSLRGVEAVLRVLAAAAALVDLELAQACR